MIERPHAGQRVTIHYPRYCRVATPYEGRTAVVQSVIDGPFSRQVDCLLDGKVLTVDARHLREV